MIQLVFSLLQSVALSFSLFPEQPLHPPMAEARLQKYGVLGLPGPIFIKTVVGHTKGVAYQKYDVCLESNKGCHATLGGRFFSLEEIAELRKAVLEHKEYLFTQLTKKHMYLQIIPILDNAVLLLDGRALPTQKETFQAFNALQAMIYKGQIPLDEKIVDIVICYY